MKIMIYEYSNYLEVVYRQIIIQTNSKWESWFTDTVIIMK